MFLFRNVSKYFGLSDPMDTLLNYILKGNLKGVQRLISEGIDVNAGNDEYQHPLYHAVREKNIDIIRVLLFAGANMTKQHYYYPSPVVLSILNNLVVINIGRNKNINNARANANNIMP